MHDAGVGRLVLASSMVVYGEGRYSCPEHGDQVPLARSVAALEAGDFDNHCTRCGGILDWALVDEDARLDPRSGYAASKLAQEHYASAWVRQADAGAVALRYHNVYGPRHAAGHAVLRGGGDVPLLPRARRPAHGVRGRRPDARLRARLRRRGRATSPPCEAVEAGFRAYNVCSGRPVSIRDVAELVASGTGSDLTPEVTGGFRLGDVRHIVASPERARAELGFVARVSPETGLREFATAPLR